jgi:hypothetical protein
MNRPCGPMWTNVDRAAACALLPPPIPSPWSTLVHIGPVARHPAAASSNGMHVTVKSKEPDGFVSHRSTWSIWSTQKDHYAPIEALSAPLQRVVGKVCAFCMDHVDHPDPDQPPTIIRSSIHAHARPDFQTTWCSHQGRLSARAQRKATESFCARLRPTLAEAAPAQAQREPGLRGARLRPPRRRRRPYSREAQRRHRRMGKLASTLPLVPLAKNCARGSSVITLPIRGAQCAPPREGALHLQEPTAVYRPPNRTRPAAKFRGGVYD